MVSLSALWLPILLSAVIVFVASSIIHAVLPIHKNDMKQMPNEPAVMAAMREAGVKPGVYLMPYCTPESVKSADVIEKYKVGPVARFIVSENGMPSLGKNLVQWFAYCVVVGVFVAYLTGRTVAPGTPYLGVFRVAGTAGFMAYGLGHLSNGIWKAQPWDITIKEVIEGLFYGALAAGTFGWLWPH